jgi:hypothetical protein
MCVRGRPPKKEKKERKGIRVHDFAKRLATTLTFLENSKWRSFMYVSKILSLLLDNKAKLRIY